LLEASGNNKAARAGFISYFQMSIGMSFADAGQRFLQPVDIIGDGAKDPDLAFGPGFSDGDGDRVFVDIEPKVVCNLFHGVVVSSYSFDESERIPRPERGRSCGSAHPGNPRNNERQPHRFFQP
jgi:hypothetical protein